MQNLLSTLKGVYNPRVTLKNAYCQVDESQISVEELQEEIDDIGFDVTSVKIIYPEDHMTTVEMLGESNEKIKSLLLEHPGVQQVDEESDRIRIHYNTRTCGVCFCLYHTFSFY